MKRSKATSGAIAIHPQQQQRDMKNRELAAIWRPTNLRVRRGVVNRGPTTPVPSWKLYENPFYDGVMQAAGGGGGANISARKLAASLWELQELPTDSSTRSPDESSSKPVLPSPESLKNSRAKKVLVEQLKSTDSNGGIEYTSRQLAAMQSHIHRLLDRQSAVKTSSGSVGSAEKQQQRPAEASPEKKPSLDGFPASAELLERLQNLEEQHSSETLAGALRTELDAARGKVKELEGANKVARREIEGLLKKISDDKTTSHGKEQDKVNHALQNVRTEIDDERKSKRRMELANKKLTRELGEAKMALSKAAQELDKERKARQLMEDVCDELAREIGDDKAEVEELKRESSRIKQEVEEERKMLQMAEVWREERVQMKLAEARDEIQAKLSTLEKLREKLEEFLKMRRRVMDDGDYASQQADIREGEMLRAALDGALSRERASAKEVAPAPALMRCDDTDDDLHSIDLTKEVSGSQMLMEKPSWNQLLEEHRLKMMRKTTKKIYCSPTEEVESVAKVRGSDQGGDMTESLRVHHSRSSDRSVKSVGSNFDSTDSCTVSSSEFDIPLGETQQQQQQHQRSFKSKSSSNGYGRNLKSLVEWTRNGVKASRA